MSVPRPGDKGVIIQLHSRKQEAGQTLLIDSPVIEQEETSFRFGWLAFLVPLLATGAVYFLTAAPGLTWRYGGEDGGDLITAVATGGVPHPTGYPLYLLFGKAALFLADDPARALNLVSALWGALGAGLVGIAAVRFYRQIFNEASFFSLVAGTGAGLATGFAPLVWSQAVITEVYSLNLALTALFLVALSFWAEKKPLALEAVALAGGLAAGYHRTGLFTVAAGLVFILLTGDGLKALKAPRLLGRPVLKFAALFLLAFFSPYLYFLGSGVRAESINWYAVSLENLGGFWQLFSATDYRTYLLGVPIAQIPEQLAAAFNLLLAQFGWPGLLLGWLAFTAAVRNRAARPLLALSGSGFLLHLLFAITYDAANSQVYLIPGFVMWALAGGCGLILALKWLAGFLEQRRLPRAYLWGAVVAGLALIVLNVAVYYGSFDLSRDSGATGWLEEQLVSAPPGAILVTADDGPTFSLWYGLYARKERPDLAVVDARLVNWPWYRQNLNTTYPNIKLGEDIISSVDPAVTARHLQALNPGRRVLAVTGPKITPEF